MKSILMKDESIKDKPSQKTSIIIEDDPELTMLLASMTKQESISFLKRAIRDTNYDDYKKVYRYLLREVIKNP